IRRRVQQRRGFSVGVIISLILLVLLIIGGSGLTYYVGVFFPAQLHAQATAAAQTAQADATFIVITPQQIYNYATNGSPVINDPLNNQNRSTWENNETCTFTGGAYHVSSLSYGDCLSQG